MTTKLHRWAFRQVAYGIEWKHESDLTDDMGSCYKRDFSNLFQLLSFARELGGARLANKIEKMGLSSEWQGQLTRDDKQ
jgi:hypothetical protein